MDKIAKPVIGLLGETMKISQKIKVGCLYKHYKGNYYKVLNVAHYSEDPSKKFVVYQALYDSPGFGKDAVWVRPYDMFVENIIVDGRQVERFEKIADKKN